MGVALPLYGGSKYPEPLLLREREGLGQIASRFPFYTGYVNKGTRLEQQNVTVSLPADLLREVRHMAVDEGVSLSRYIALLLEAKVEERQQFKAARERQMSLLQRGLPLGTGGRIDWTRAELHER